MRRQHWLGLGIGLVLLSPMAAADAPKKEDWVPLFNGTDLEGWSPKIRGYEFGENFGNTFRVQDGCITVSYEAYPNFENRFGHLFYTKKTFSKYRLRLEYRFIGDQVPGGPGWATRNSGIMIHGEPGQNMVKDQDFPVSIEVQLLGGLGNNKPRTTGNLCTPGTNVVMDGMLITKHCINSNSKTFDGEQWVRCEVESHGAGAIKHSINGELVLAYSQTQLDPKDARGKLLADQRGGHLHIDGGTISLQSESHPVQFRNIAILELKE